MVRSTKYEVRSLFLYQYNHGLAFPKIAAHKRPELALYSKLYFENSMRPCVMLRFGDGLLPFQDEHAFWSVTFSGIITQNAAKKARSIHRNLLTGPLAPSVAHHGSGIVAQ